MLCVVDLTALQVLDTELSTRSDRVEERLGYLPVPPTEIEHRLSIERPTVGWGGTRRTRDRQRKIDRSVEMNRPGF